ncbi:MAG: peptidylprolyl isomerase [Comamonas sp.]
MRFPAFPRHAVSVSVLCLSALACVGVQAQGLRAAGAPGTSGLSRALEQTQAPELRREGAASGLRSADYIVAVVNSEPVTNNEVRARMARVEESMAREGAAQRPPQAQLAREVLERLILEKAQIQYAKEVGIKVDDYAVDQGMEAVARNNSISKEQLVRELRKEGLNEATFREELRRQMLLQRLREREVDNRVKVSEQDIDRYLREQRRKPGANAEAAAPAAMNLGHILVAVPEGASDAEVAQRKARAEEAAQAARTEGFEAVAQRYSDTKGDAAMGLRPADAYPELFVQAVRGANVGAVVGPVRSAAGFHVLKVIDKSTSGMAMVVTQNHARHILLRPTAQMDEREAAARLAELRNRVVQGNANFEALARQYSQDGSAAQGGDLGWAGPGRYVPEFEQVLDRLQPGEISPPVVSRFGVHLIQLVERRQAALNPREQREQLRDVVKAQKTEKDYDTWLQELRGRTYVEYREAPH